MLPCRVHHHVGIEHLVPTGFMVDRIREAVAARADPETLIIGRTNALRLYDMDEALRRGEAYRGAGADMVLIHTRDAEEKCTIGERLGPPLMIFAPADGFGIFPLSQADLANLGFRLAASSGSAFAAMYTAIRQSYHCLANDRIDPLLGPGGAGKAMRDAHKTTGLDELLEIEVRTMGAD